MYYFAIFLTLNFHSKIIKFVKYYINDKILNITMNFSKSIIFKNNLNKYSLYLFNILLSPPYNKLLVYVMISKLKFVFLFIANQLIVLISHKMNLFINLMSLTKIQELHFYIFLFVE